MKFEVGYTTQRWSHKRNQPRYTNKHAVFVQRQLLLLNVATVTLCYID